MVNRKIPISNAPGCKPLHLPPPFTPTPPPSDSFTHSYQICSPQESTSNTIYLKKKKSFGIDLIFQKFTFVYSLWNLFPSAVAVTVFFF